MCLLQKAGGRVCLGVILPLSALISKCEINLHFEVKADDQKVTPKQNLNQECRSI